jgi:aspartate racemase
MKTIGLIGGMSAESSIEYYRIINETIREKLGGLHSAKSVMVSVDFAEIEALQSSGKWNEATEIMVTTARQVEKGGADFMLICTNTMHKMAPQVLENINIPLLHIADATADTIIDQGYQKIGLLGTRFTMEQDFYKDRLINKHGLDVLIPGKNERKTIDEVIFNELVQGKILPASKNKYIKIMGDLVNAGAQGIILGCTEIGLLVSENDCEVPLFDTTQIHAQAAVQYALSE